MTMKQTLFLGLLLLLFSIFSSSSIHCRASFAEKVPQESSGSTTAQDQAKTLNIITHGKGQKNFYTFIEKHIKEFSFRHPDVEIHYLDGTELDLGMNFDKSHLAAYYAQMIRSGELQWDVIWMDPPIYSRVADQLHDFEWGKKHLVDFSTVENFNKTMKPAIINDPIYKKGTGGIFTGPFLEGYVGVAWYNRKLAEKLGLDIKQYGMSFDDLLEYARVVDSYNRDNDHKIALLADAATDKRVTLEYMFQNLVKSEIADFNQARIEEISVKKLDALLTTFQALEKLAPFKPLLENRKGLSMYDAMWAVMEDKALFHMFGPWNYQFYLDKYGENEVEKIVPAELPVFQEVDYYLGGFIPGLAVFKNAANRDLAIKLLMSFTTARAVEDYVRMTKNPSGIQGNLTTLKDLETDRIMNFFIEIDEKYKGRVHKAFNPSYLLGAENHRLSEELDMRIHSILEGRVSALQAYEEIVAMLKHPPVVDQ